MNLQIAICDDEKVDLDYLLKIVERWAKESRVVITVSTFPSAESFLFRYEDSKAFDILLLDIQMKEMNGLELAKRIRMQNSDMQIIFITGYPDYMSDGYDVSALHYLMKPVDEPKLIRVLAKAIHNLSKVSRSIFLASENEMVRIPINDIMYVESFAHEIQVKTTGRLITTRMKISDLEADLGEGFIRCHRSYLVGLSHVLKIGRLQLCLDDGRVIPMSRRLYSSINQAFIKYFKGDD